MSSASYILFLLIVICSLPGCKELYYPDIEPASKTIAVEGLITSQPGPYNIRLTHSTTFLSDSASTPVRNAVVKVTDDNGAEFEFNEVSPGHYQSPPTMTATPGSTYTLHFETNEGDIFRSYPQTLLPAYEIEGLLAEKSSITFSRETPGGELIITEEEGIDAFLALKDYHDNTANIRFRTDVKLLYIYEGGSFANPQRFYCWRELRRFEGINNINLPAAGNRPGDVNNNLVAFLPNDKEKFYLDYFDFLNALLIKVTLFSINEDAYSYYLNIHSQLVSDESIFAPVPSQIFSNIYCTSDENKKAVGLFEVSSVSSGGFILRKPPGNDSLSFEPTEKYDDIPSEGCLVDEIPPFWVY